jgi:hypothetical protein
LDFQELNVHIQKTQLKDLNEIKITPEVLKKMTSLRLCPPPSTLGDSNSGKYSSYGVFETEDGEDEEYVPELESPRVILGEHHMRTRSMFRS